jgi:hypothetical protein
VQLAGLVQGSNDPFIYTYVDKNLGAGVPPSPFGKQLLGSVRSLIGLAFADFVVSRGPSLTGMSFSTALTGTLPNFGPKSALTPRGAMKKAPGVSTPLVPSTPQLGGSSSVRDQLLLFQSPLLQRKPPAQLYQETLQAEKLKAQQEALLKAVEERYQLLNQRFGEMLEKTADALLDDLQADDPLTRFLAVHAVGKRRLHLEQTLIDLLADPVAEVRQAARGALARLSRGTDFGPLPTANAAQVRHAQDTWCQWLLMQDPPAQSDEPG